MTFEIAATPQEAVDRLELLYEQARTALRDDLQRFFLTAQPPTLEERALYRYPMLRVTYEPSKLPAATRRGYAKFAIPGIYSTTVTQPGEFRAYLLDQLQPLVAEYGATIETGVSNQEIPTPMRSMAATSPVAARLPPPNSPGISRRRSWHWSAMRSPTAPSRSSRASRARSRSSMRSGSIIRCDASSTTPAPTGAQCSPGCC